MTRSKLSDLEKQEIVSCFEQQQDTIPGLAERYQVSSSTIRRLLKQVATESSITEPSIAEPVVAESVAIIEPIAPAEGIVLDKKPKLLTKRSAAQAPQPQPETLDHPASLGEAEPRVVAPPTLRAFREETQDSPQDSLSLPSRHSSKRSEEDWQDNPVLSDLDLPASISGPERAKPLRLRSITPPQEEMSAILEDLGHGLGPAYSSSAVEEEDEDSEEFDEEDYDADEDDLDDFSLTGPALQLQPEVLLEVMPFDQAVLPKVCYLVVDRTAELVTRPLKDFGELGQIPAHEVQSCTLPVFDNHRIARRFSHRNQRIIKVPNGNMLRSTSTQLSAKGITRLLINGRIYAL